MTNRRHNAAIFGAMVLMGCGLLLLVLLMAGCQSHSRITPATSAATRTTESKGPRTTLKTTVKMPEGKP